MECLEEVHNINIIKSLHQNIGCLSSKNNKLENISEIIAKNYIGKSKVYKILNKRYP